jgi:hypothetical protein
MNINCKQTSWKERLWDREREIYYPKNIDNVKERESEVGVERSWVTTTGEWDKMCVEEKITTKHCNTT